MGSSYMVTGVAPSSIHLYSHAPGSEESHSKRNAGVRGQIVGHRGGVRTDFLVVARGNQHADWGGTWGYRKNVGQASLVANLRSETVCVPRPNGLVSAVRHQNLGKEKLERCPEK